MISSFIITHYLLIINYTIILSIFLFILKYYKMCSLLIEQSPLLLAGVTAMFLLLAYCNTNSINTVIIIYFITVAILFILYRNPVRTPTNNKSYVYSPSDGKVMKIIETDTSYIIQTFLSPLDVHIQYAPLDGVISKIVHKPGTFHLAYEKKADNNESLTTYMRTKIGTVKTVQIAGRLFRRSVNFFNVGDRLKTGQQYGMIKFSSRVDTTIPKKGLKLLIKKGDRLQAAISKIAQIKIT